MSNVKIISDGTAGGTKVFVGNEIMSGVSLIEIDPILPGGLVRARLTVCVVDLEMIVTDVDVPANVEVGIE